jgi:hypothetical protein
LRAEFLTFLKSSEVRKYLHSTHFLLTNREDVEPSEPAHASAPSRAQSPAQGHWRPDCQGKLVLSELKGHSNQN